MTTMRADDKSTQEFMNSLRTAADADGDLGLADLIDSGIERLNKEAKNAEAQDDEEEHAHGKK